jgi:hypothetical protein
MMTVPLSGALFSFDRKHRLKLWRHIKQDDVHLIPLGVLFIGLNPSTANETEDDPTIRRCVGFAKDWGFSMMFMGNLFSYVTSNPKELTVANCLEYHEQNWNSLKQMSGDCTRVVYCWGVHGDLHGKGEAIVEFLDPYLLCEPVCFGINKNGQPRHPLYLPKNAEVIKYAQ